MKILLFGYGNIDRQDDGVAWHILRGIAERYGEILPITPEDTTGQITDNLSFTYALQLTPESAEWVSEFDKIIFIDAHTGSIEEPMHVEELSSNFQTSPFTHHLTPQTCLALAESIYGKAPQGLLVSVRGYEFGFSQYLSSATRDLAMQAIRKISIIIDQSGD